MTRIRFWMALGSVLVLSILLLEITASPYIWIFFLLACVSLAVGIARSHFSTIARTVGINLAEVFLALAGAEIYFSRQIDPIRYEGSYTTEAYRVNDDVLGYAPKPGIARHVRKYFALAWEESEKYFNPRTMSIANQVIAAMLKRGMRVHFVSSILPGYLDDMTPYIIDPREIHPNAYAYELLSDYVVVKILSVGISPGAVGHL